LKNQIDGKFQSVQYWRGDYRDHPKNHNVTPPIPLALLLCFAGWDLRR
jgi:hypothetical protein